MRRLLIGASALAFAGAAAAQDARAITVEAVDGRRVSLHGADVKVREDGATDVHGWARRARAQAGLINAHLQVWASSMAAGTARFQAATARRSHFTSVSPPTWQTLPSAYASTSSPASGTIRTRR